MTLSWEVQHEDNRGKTIRQPYEREEWADKETEYIAQKFKVEARKYRIVHSDAGVLIVRQLIVRRVPDEPGWQPRI